MNTRTFIYFSLVYEPANLVIWQFEKIVIIFYPHNRSEY